LQQVLHLNGYRAGSRSDHTNQRRSASFHGLLTWRTSRFRLQNIK
jgi:hypothetical protein